MDRTLNLTRDHRLALDATGRPTLFELDTCETCGGPVQQANAMVTDLDGWRALEALGVPTLNNMPPEQWYNDLTGMCACDNCNGEA